MLEKNGVVRTATQVTHGNIGFGLCCGSPFRTADVLSGRPVEIGAGFGLDFRQSSYTIPPFGPGTTLATSRRNCLRVGTDDAPNFGPETATSILK